MLQRFPPTADDFTTWHAAYTPKLAKLARRLVGPELAEDVVQQAWLRAWRARRRFRWAAQPGSWLYRIIYTTAMDCHRKQARSLPSVSLDDADDVVSHEVPADTIAAQRAKLRAVAVAWRQLPTRERAALRLVGLHGLWSTEAGRRMGMSTNTVKSRVRRGRQRLLRLIATLAFALVASQLFAQTPTVTLGDRLGFDQIAADVATAQGYAYSLYLDGSATATPLLAATCAAGGTVGTQACVVGFPTLTVGQHAITLTAATTVAGVRVESARSSPFVFVFVGGAVSPPSNLRVVKP